MANHHLAGFFEDQDGAGTLQNLAALADTLSPLFPVEATDFLRVSAPYTNIAGIYAAIDATVQPRARLTAASFRESYRRGSVEIPYLSDSIEPGSPPTWNDLRSRPIPLKASERLGVETLNNPAAAANQFVLCWFTDAPIAPVDPAGGYWTRWTTAASAVTADAFTSRALVQDENLIAGTYEVLGVRGISTSLIAGRLAFQDRPNRPGFLGADARTDIPHPAFLPGGMGVYGTFHTDNPPSVDLLCNAADNEVQVVDLYVRPTGRRVA